MQAVLEVTAGPHSGRKIVLSQGIPVRIGRTAKADYVVAEDTFLSGAHFYVECTGDKCIVRDLGSSNGTLLNGSRISESELHEGDTITAGQSSFALHLDAAGEAVAHEPAMSLDETRPFKAPGSGQPFAPPPPPGNPPTFPPPQFNAPPEQGQPAFGSSFSPSPFGNEPQFGAPPAYGAPSPFNAPPPPPGPPPFSNDPYGSPPAFGSPAPWNASPPPATPPPFGNDPYGAPPAFGSPAPWNTPPPPPGPPPFGNDPFGGQPDRGAPPQFNAPPPSPWNAPPPPSGPPPFGNDPFGGPPDHGAPPQFNAPPPQPWNSPPPAGPPPFGNDPFAGPPASGSTPWNPSPPPPGPPLFGPTPPSSEAPFGGPPSFLSSTPASSSAFDAAFGTAAPAPPVAEAPKPEPVEAPGKTSSAVLLETLNGLADPMFALVDSSLAASFIDAARAAGDKVESMSEGSGVCLVPLNPESQLAEQLAKDGWGKGWGILLTSRQPIAIVRNHLRRFQNVMTQDGVEFQLHLAKPGLLRALLPTLSAEDTKTFFGPITAILTEGETGDGLVLFMPSARGAIQKAIALGAGKVAAV